MRVIHYPLFPFSAVSAAWAGQQQRASLPDIRLRSTLRFPHFSLARCTFHLPHLLVKDCTLGKAEEVKVQVEKGAPAKVGLVARKVQRKDPPRSPLHRKSHLYRSQVPQVVERPRRLRRLVVAAERSPRYLPGNLLLGELKVVEQETRSLVRGQNFICPHSYEYSN